jgi:glycosyltransferase involved in cell wall biosynthesis
VPGAPLGRTLAIIPAYNEAQALPVTLSDLRRALPDVDVVVVDDGSSDGTFVVAASCGVRVLRLPYNLGIGGALRTGFRYALERGYDRAFQFDADGQHDPNEVGKLLEQLDNGANMVVGSRFSEGGPDYAVGLLRKIAMGSLTRIVRVLLHKTFTDTSSGFRAFDARVLQYFATNYPAEYMESVEALVLAHRAGFEVVETPVRMRGRTHGQPSNRRLHLVYHLMRLYLVLGTSSRRGPMHSVPEASIQ